jgi:hypothetical protein
MKMTIEEVRRGMAGSDFDIDKNRYYDAEEEHHLCQQKETEDKWSDRFPNITFWIVELQYRSADLPPYIWALCRVFLSKSQAIAFAKELKNKYNDIRIRCQKNLRQLKVVYRILDDGTVEKIKEA